MVQTDVQVKKLFIHVLWNSLEIFEIKLEEHVLCLLYGLY